MTDSQQIVLKFGGYQPPASVHTRAADVFGRELTARLGDQIVFQFDANIVADGHNAKELLSRVESGALSMCYFSASYLADRVAEFALLDLPFMFKNRAHAYAVLDGPLQAYLADKLSQNTGYKLMGFWDNGFRHFSNSVRPIRVPKDCQGLTIRTLFSDLHGQVFKALGFDPVPLDVKDLIAGIESGAVTAQENPLTNTYNFGIHHHHKYMTLSSHFFGAAALLCNARIYDAWPPHVQAAVDEAAKLATSAQRGFAAQEDAVMLAKLAETDAQVIELSVVEQALFAAAAEPVMAAQRQRFGDDLFALVEADMKP
ncbi:MAG: TRAP transporter substrate-binding protein [Rhodospirillales bacterium]|nr:TRAP transporter substrate-binding protein [Rhodospirillales bacterium]